MPQRILLYSLPHDCPIPWPTHPTYAIVDPTELRPELDQAYLQALFPPLDSNNLVKLLAFARLLLALVSELSRDEVEAKVRSIILPVNDFNHKWRNTIPSLVRTVCVDDSNTSTSDRPVAPPPTSKKDKLGDEEKQRMLECFQSWRKAEQLRIEKDRPAPKVPDVEDLVQASDEVNLDPEANLGSLHAEAAEEIVHKPLAWTKKEVDFSDWITAAELLDTQLQSMLLLLLLSLPAQTGSPAVKPKKKKDPERHASTLDPELLLDLLTDRLQIWRVMKDVNDLGLGSTIATKDKDKKGQAKIEIDNRDEAQIWWTDVVEKVLTSHVPTEIISRNRAKLFPSAAPTDAFGQRLPPPPSPFKTRSLMSLDKSARRKERDHRPLVAESPTMKRLLGVQATFKAAGDTFKVPSMPTLKRKLGERDATSTASAKTDNQKEVSAPDAAPIRSKPPRKQERPRPLPRGDRLSGSSKTLFNRREVTFGKRTTSTGLKKKPVDQSQSQSQSLSSSNRSNKRKSLSPKKSSSSASLTLVPDTPAASRTSSASISVQAPIVPSFAALGAAFRPGASMEPDYLPASLSGSAHLGLNDEDENELYLRGYERDNGKSRVDSIMGTPEQPARKGWVVPDT